MTGKDLINGALRLIGVLAEGETPSAQMASDALLSLNDLIDSWSNESLLTTPIVRDVLALSSAGLKQTYTWGTGGDLNTSRPMRVQTAIIQLTGSNPPIELPMKILNQDEYASETLKTLTSNFPLYCYIDEAYPTRNVSVWPVPTDSTNALIFYSQKPLTLASLSGTFSLPPGYLRALRFNLSLDLAPEYGKVPTPELMELAIQSKAAIKRNNKKPYYLQVDPAIRASQGTYNWRTDGYEK